MMLYKVSLLAVFLLFGCSERQDFYHGYVYDGETEKPLAKVLVKENVPGNAKYTYTDAKGYFKLDNKGQSFTALIFSSEKHRVDTLPSIWAQGGETLKHRFFNTKPDTVFLMPKDKL